MFFFKILTDLVAPINAVYGSTGFVLLIFLILISNGNFLLSVNMLYVYHMCLCFCYSFSHPKDFTIYIPKLHCTRQHLSGL